MSASAEGKSHTVAVRALSNVWVRIIFAMLKHEPYARPSLSGSDASMLASGVGALFLRGKTACFFAFN